MSHENIVHEETVEPFTIKIIQDQDIQNPFEDWDWTGIALCLDFGREGELKTPNAKDLDRETIGEWLQAGKVTDESSEFYGWKMFPVQAYIHSGITVSLGSFSCPWDSGTCGLVLIDPAAFTRGDLGGTPEQHAATVIQTADDYLTGNVYGYSVENADGDSVDSCWGFFGDYETFGCLGQARAAARANIADAALHTDAQATD